MLTVLRAFTSALEAVQTATLSIILTGLFNPKGYFQALLELKM